MKQDLQVPKNYKPLSRLTLCSNTLIDVQVPFEIEGGVPLLIGGNGEPEIWLNARPPKPDMEWYPVIRQNRPLHKEAQIQGVGGELISITIQGTRVLTLEKREGNVLEVTELDLRPIGLNIHGDRSGLMVGSTQLVSNTFSNVYVMVGIGDRKAARSN